MGLQGAGTLDEVIDTLRGEYARRDADPRLSARYSSFDSVQLAMIQRRQRAVVRLLQDVGHDTLRGLRVLEVGSGHGGILRELAFLGADSNSLFGIDVILPRCQEGKSRSPWLQVAVADGRTLPFADGTFDIVCQFTAFSSVVNPDARIRMAKEMRRVLAAEGTILWYDYWVNPTNSRVRAIRKGELRQLFPGGRMQRRRVTFAPPLARLLGRRMDPVVGLLERLGALNTHYLAAIRWA